MDEGTFKASVSDGIANTDRSSARVPEKTMSSKDGVHIVVCGAESTGKTSLITAAATESFPETVAPKLPVTRLPGSTLQDGADAFLIDTSSRQEDRAKRMEECHRAHVIVMTYAVDDLSTLRYLSRSLLPALREEGITVPIVLVGCKLDTRPDGSETSEAEIVDLMNDFREIETCLECSAKKLIQVSALPSVFRLIPCMLPVAPSTRPGQKGF
ncbi:hypothetical protein CYMTET_10731 [Cymbomonas tetramitiformis]|uniref:Uncharacterized protein n=1 Tax=Cymbomonas tetramitiformis TaxID=36881 RepID=A0AAE0LE65_9CHLO|nr:hypothetical protein CYMTET_10731 [Cymbomonas tetramitiformis]